MISESFSFACALALWIESPCLFLKNLLHFLHSILDRKLDNLNYYIKIENFDFFFNNKSVGLNELGRVKKRKKKNKITLRKKQ